MKTLIKVVTMGIIISMTFTNCKKEKGCTDSLAMNFEAKAEENDGSCKYAYGTFTITSENCTSSAGTQSDTYTMAVTGNTTLTINNFANQFNNIVATRNGTSITISSKSGVQDKSGNYWDLNGGSGTIAWDGSTITFNYSFDDINYLNLIGMVNCSDVFIISENIICTSNDFGMAKRKKTI
jgi:hypothetical protein